MEMNQEIFDWIDTHSHLYLPQFADDRAEVIQRCDQKGVRHILLPDIDHESTRDLWAMVEAFPGRCFGMSGLHPCSVQKDFEAQLMHVQRVTQEQPVIAIGEIGLDYYWDQSLIAEQKEVFKRQIQLAQDLSLPIVIHSRDSLDDTIAMVEASFDGGLRGVFHCFNGNIEQMHRIQSMGFYMGLGGVITFKNSKMEEVLREIDLEKVILETDAPYLTPVPYRGGRNESSYLPLIGKKLAETRGLPLRQIAEMTFGNALDLFALST